MQFGAGVPSEIIESFFNHYFFVKQLRAGLKRYYQKKKER